MKEGRIEKINKGEKSILEKIAEFRKKEIEKGPNQWKMITPKLLLPEAIKIFELIEKQEFEAAKTDLELLRQEIEKLRGGDSKTVNEAFLTYFDDKIIKIISDKENAEFKEKDNT
jgi:predicted nuclease with TOPRIM domain